MNIMLIRNLQQRKKVLTIYTNALHHLIYHCEDSDIDKS